MESQTTNVVRLKFGQTIRAARAAQGFTQAELARRMREQGHNWHHSTVAKVEAGARPTNVEELIALASVLGFPVQQLIEPDGSAVLVRELVAKARELSWIATEIAQLEDRKTELAERYQRGEEELNRLQAEFSALPDSGGGFGDGNGNHDGSGVGFRWENDG